MFSDIYKSILDEYGESDLTKGQKTKLKIVEAAIEVYATLQEDKVTFKMIAEKSNVTRPLITHHFKDKNEIFSHAVKLVRDNMQKFVFKFMKNEKKASKLLHKYFHAVFKWIEEYPTHYTFWLAFYHKCNRDKKSNQLNSGMTEMGRARIQNILEMGIKNKEFKCKDPFITAKTIQTIITGGCLVLQTEKFPIAKKVFIDDLYKSVTTLLRR